MTVGELIRVLTVFERDALVYVPDKGGKLEISKGAIPLEHVPDPRISGVIIPPDVAILPLSYLMPPRPDVEGETGAVV